MVSFVLLVACALAHRAPVAPRAPLAPRVRCVASVVGVPRFAWRSRCAPRAVADDGRDERSSRASPSAAPIAVPSQPLFSTPALVAALVAYVYFVFVSDAIPGPNALTLDPATWREAFQLSTNFWLILPLAGAGPTLHPGLEAIFNFDLIWAALFAGLLVDGRSQPRPFGPFLLAMQFLTAPVYLSYLALREPAPQRVGARALSAVERAAESRALPVVLGALGVGALAWGALGRPEFGDLARRTESLRELLSADRLGSSFLVDMAVFAVYQGALIPDDLARRGAGASTAETRRLAAIGSTVPFFGLAWYLASRPALQPLASRAGGGEQARPNAASVARAPLRARAAPVRLPWSATRDASDPAAPVRAYFDAWNRRAMVEAVDCASADVVYEDTLFAGKFVGRDALARHLDKCAAALPGSVRFVLDDVAASGELVGTRWHVELADGTPLPFARGASMYRVRDGLIVEGFDVPEPTLKTGALSLAVLSVASRVGTALGLLK
ncbi:hypothetical protein KFE25_007380 [Diacronema lutheri]|uniref:SnoaL-like domain-containing protein n=1 Tax=Diacronema lutheri TaxID=2081491 RepID=A0A8J6CBK8_DIALT|nr:hypothetical protein KFE25_007380 [Diacronema lutheri]